MRDWTEIHREIRETLTGCGICQLPGERDSPKFGHRCEAGKENVFRDGDDEGSRSAGSGLPLPDPDPRGKEYSLR